MCQMKAPRVLVPWWRLLNLALLGRLALDLNLQFAKNYLSSKPIQLMAAAEQPALQLFSHS